LTFDHFALDPAVRQALAASGITAPTPIQAAALPRLLAGQDVLGQARTGSGKTLAFGLPLIQRCDPRVAAVQALVLAPTRELVVQIASVLTPLAAKRNLKVSTLYGGRGLGGEVAALRAGTQIIIGAPGRTLDHLRQRTLSLAAVTYLVLDEADEMLDRGFAPDVERIIGHTPTMRQTALFSATIPEWVLETARKHQRDPETVRVDRADEATPGEVRQIVYDMDLPTRFPALRAVLDERVDGPMLVFGRTKHGVRKLAKQLADLGYPAAALQGNMSQNARERVMADFRSGAVPILVATNVAARGIDVTGIDQVVNYELPESPELFTHRVGRTGRMGRHGEAITFVTAEDAAKWREIQRAMGRPSHRVVRLPWPGFHFPTTENEPVERAAPVRSVTPVPPKPPKAERDEAPRPRRDRPRPARGPAADERSSAPHGRPGSARRTLVRDSALPRGDDRRAAGDSVPVVPASDRDRTPGDHVAERRENGRGFLGAAATVQAEGSPARLAQAGAPYYPFRAARPASDEGHPRADGATRRPHGARRPTTYRTER